MRKPGFGKIFFMAMMIAGVCLITAGCGDDKDTEAPAETTKEETAAEQKQEEAVAPTEAPVEDVEIVQEFAEENTEEEDGEVEELTLESTQETVGDQLQITVKPVSDDRWFWKSLVSDEAVIAYDNDKGQEDGSQRFVFVGKGEGTAQVDLFYLETGDEIDVPEGEDASDYSDVSVTVSVDKDHMVKLVEG